MPEPESATQGYETRDANVRAVVQFALGLVVICAVIAIAVIGLYRLLEGKHPSPDSASRIALHPRMLAPLPQLQTAPAADYEALRAAEDSKLKSYGWIDRQNGVVRIPIARAMDLIAERGLPTRGDGTPDASGVTSAQMQERKAVAK